MRTLRRRSWSPRVAVLDPLPSQDIQGLTVRHDPDGARGLPDSTGLGTGLLTPAHAFVDAGAADSTGVALARELRHIPRATDTCVAASGQPRAIRRA